MKVLALTHAHLNKRGLSPVSCERADSITGTWAEKLHWDVDVVHTKDTKWAGIWPDGKGLKINIISADPPIGLMQTPPQLFAAAIRELIAKRNFSGLFSLIYKRIAKRLRHRLATNGWAWSSELVDAKKWGNYLAKLPAIEAKRYDFLFVCVGYSDEYLLQTALTICEQFKIPMAVDFRDLWSDHHDPNRFSTRQKQLILVQEKRLLKKTVLISVPQKHMMVLLNKWVQCPVCHVPHSAYMDPAWEDGQSTSAEFRMLYAGKLYAGGPGLKMLMELLKKLAGTKTSIPVRCVFYVDDTKSLKELAAQYGITNIISVNEWIAPSELWKELRSAHLLVIPDSGVAENYPLMPTKTFQYAFTGRQLLCLLEFRNDEIESFLNQQNAGIACYDADSGYQWILNLMKDNKQYNELPPIRNLPTRDIIAANFGREIEKIIA